jgi:hypothetical protein
MLRVAKTLVTNKEETSRRFYTKPHPFDCGIDRHARTMDVCILDQAGETLVHRHMPATPEALLKAIAPLPRSGRPGCRMHVDLVLAG